MRKLYLILLLPIFWLTSCNDFLDVSADNELLQKEIFADYKGVRMGGKRGVSQSLVNEFVWTKSDVGICQCHRA